MSHPTRRQAYGADFNRKAAARTYDLVMKMADGEAQEFVTHVAYDLLQADITRNREVLSKHVREVKRSVVNGVAQAVRKGLLPMSAFEEISKSTQWDEQRVKRDKGGQFSRTESRVKTPGNIKGLNRRGERASGIPSAKALAGPNVNAQYAHKMGKTERARYQAQYSQLAEKMNEYAERGVHNPKMVLESKQTGNRREMDAVKDGRIGYGWNASTDNLVAIRGVTSGGTAAADASFDMVSALGGSEETATRTGEAVRGAQRGGHSFADKWTDSSRDDPGSSNARTYRRVQAGSELLGQVAPHSSKAQAAAALGGFVGEFGPEAEKVLGPAARKAAYRYRGTERKPDRALLELRDQALQSAAGGNDVRSVTQQVTAGMSAEEKQRAKQAKARGEEYTRNKLDFGEVRAQAAQRIMGMPVEAKQMASVQAATQYLSDRVPSPRLSEIQRKAGRIPPSEGVMINAKGEIVHQSIGNSDDHYLPFNLGNLKDLRDGEYVRTRSAGGLTTEDIYTGLVSGARQVTVVSNSGVFTIDFSPDFRGVRRYNDKAAGMVERYGKILDAIKEGQIEHPDRRVTPEIKAEIREEVERDHPKSVFTTAQINAEYDRRVREYKQMPDLTSNELAEIDTRAKRNARDEAQYRRNKSLLVDEAREAKADRFYKLDGEGYSAALQALKEQFPYYIDEVTFLHKRGGQGVGGEQQDPTQVTDAQASRYNTASDTGYVKDKYNRPEGVLEGYFDPTVQGQGSYRQDGQVTGKDTADRTNYQNWENNPLRRQAPKREAQTQETRPEGAERPAEGPAQAKATPDAREDFKGAAEEFRSDKNRQASFSAALSQVSNLGGIDESNYPNIAAAVADPEKAFNDKAARDGVVSEMESLSAAMKGGDEGQKKFASDLDKSLTKMKMTASTSWSPESMGTRSEKPFEFPEAAYKDGAPANAVSAEKTRLGKMVGTEDMELWDDKRLQDYAVHSGRLSEAIGSGDANSILREWMEVAELSGIQQQSVVESKFNMLIGEGDHATDVREFAAKAEGAERMRALKGVTVTPDRQKPEQPQQSAPKQSVNLEAELTNRFSQAAQADADIAEDITMARDLIKSGKMDQAQTLLQDINLNDQARDILKPFLRKDH